MRKLCQTLSIRYKTNILFLVFLRVTYHSRGCSGHNGYFSVQAFAHDWLLLYVFGFCCSFRLKLWVQQKDPTAIRWCKIFQLSAFELVLSWNLMVTKWWQWRTKSKALFLLVRYWGSKIHIFEYWVGFCPGNVAVFLLCNPTNILLDDGKFIIKYESHNDIIQRSPTKFHADQSTQYTNRHDVTTLHGTYHGIIYIHISKLLQSFAYS